MSSVHCWCYSPRQTTPASSSWSQNTVLPPRCVCLQSTTALSDPLQFMLDKNIGPLPAPNTLWVTAMASKTMKNTNRVHCILQTCWHTMRSSYMYVAVLNLVCLLSESSPSCLQTTAASASSQSWLHIVPHWLLRHTSTLPRSVSSPPTSLSWPLAHELLLPTTWRKLYWEDD